MRQLVLAGPTEGTYEVIYDFRPSEGSTGGEVDNYPYTETLEGTDLDTAGGIVVPLVVDPAGNLSRSSGGAPGTGCSTPAAWTLCPCSGRPSPPARSTWATPGRQGASTGRSGP